jgi:hypothetical protein
MKALHSGTFKVWNHPRYNLSLYRSNK